MEDNQILLLSQLLNSIIENFNSFQKSYAEQNKELFDSSKKAILEVQSKINYLLKKY
jgi:hypothetical protein